MDEGGLTSAPHHLLTRCSLFGLRGRGPEEGGLNAIRRTFRSLGVDSRGATAIEYGLIAALIAVASISGFRALGGGAGGMWSNIAGEIQNS